MQFQQDWPKDKKTIALLFFLPENLEKFRSTKLYGAPLEDRQLFFIAAHWAFESAISPG